MTQETHYLVLEEEEDDQHIPLWILSFLGVGVAILIVLPNLWGSFARNNKRGDKEE